jgi:hypothetical protein
LIIGQVLLGGHFDEDGVVELNFALHYFWYLNIEVDFIGLTYVLMVEQLGDGRLVNRFNFS